MNSLGLSIFLFPRVENTILQKDYIKSIRLTFNYDESFGNEYIKISYYIDLNEKFDTLPSEQQETLSKTFTGNPSYIFSLVTHSKRWKREQEHEILIRMVEFKNIYVSLASYITVQFEKYLCPQTSIYIQNPDHWPELNYAEKYLEQFSYPHKRYKSFHQDYKIQVAQHAPIN